MIDQESQKREKKVVCFMNVDEVVQDHPKMKSMHNDIFVTTIVKIQKRLGLIDETYKVLIHQSQLGLKSIVEEWAIII